MAKGTNAIHINEKALTTACLEENTKTKISSGFYILVFISLELLLTEFSCIALLNLRNNL